MNGLAIWGMVGGEEKVRPSCKKDDREMGRDMFTVTDTTRLRLQLAWTGTHTWFQ